MLVIIHDLIYLADPKAQQKGFGSNCFLIRMGMPVSLSQSVQAYVFSLDQFIAFSSM